METCALQVFVEFQKPPEYQLYAIHKDEHNISVINVTNYKELDAH